jgi:23S rRNA (uracil1939-C5)-methyltransferase
MKISNIKLRIDSLNPEGWGVGVVENKTFWILNALPGELVEAELFRRRKGIYFGRANHILESNPHRLEPKESHFTASSPWQIMDLEYENQIKRNLIVNSLQSHSIELSDFEIQSPSEKDSWGYRNKVEFSFYGDEHDQLHFAFYARGGGNSKFILPHGSALVPEIMNKQASQILDFLNQKQIRARQLKTLLLRYSFHQKTVLATIFYKDSELNFNPKELNLLLNEELVGLRLAYSTPKSPASVITEVTYEIGANILTEEIANFRLIYPIDSFFQINPAHFSICVRDIQIWLQTNLPSSKNFELTDLYAGVGVIGLVLASQFKSVLASEIFSQAEEYANLNARQNNITNYSMRALPAEQSLLDIQAGRVVCVDPPRAGLHPKVIDRIIQVTPPVIIYLSCNYVTQARDLASLLNLYEVKYLKAYNFYPHTPHLESLMILTLKP